MSGSKNNAHRERPLLLTLISGAALAGAIRVAGAGLTFCFFLVVARLTSAETFGTFSTIYSIATILGYIANAGQHVAILKLAPAAQVSGVPGAERDVISRGFLTVLLCNCLLFLLLAMLTNLTDWLPRLDGIERYNVWLLAGQLMAVFAIAEYCASVFRTQGRIVFALAPRDIAWRLVSIVLIIAVAQAVTVDANLATTATASALCVAIVLQVLSVVRALLPSLLDRRFVQQFSMSYFVETLQFWISTSTKPVVDYATTIVVAFTLGPTMAAMYFAADRLAKLLSIALISTEQISAPLLAKNFHSGDHKRAQVIAAATSAMATAITAGGVLIYAIVGSYALGLFGAGYEQAYPVLIVLSLAQLMSTYAGSNVVTLLMTGGQNKLTIIWLVWGTLGIVGTYYASVYFGVLGAALSTLLVTLGWNIHATLMCKNTSGIKTAAHHFRMKDLLEIVPRERNE